MAEQQEAQADAPAKTFSLKTLIILASVFLLEGAAISAVFIFSGGPDPVEAKQAQADELAKLEEPTTLLVVQEKFPNLRTGMTVLYETEVFITVKRKHAAKIESKIEQLSAQLRQDIGTFIRKADPAHLSEPTFATLRRQIHAALDERLGRDEASGESYVLEVVIPKVIPFSADG